jgi:hypothetical protein
MLIRHATPRHNVLSILRLGLLTARSQCKRPAVWLHAPGATPWAILHVARRHGVRAESVVVLEVEVSRKWLRRARRGLWYTLRDMPTERIRRLVPFGELAGLVRH